MPESNAAHADFFDQIRQHGVFLANKNAKIPRGKQLTLSGADLTGIKLAGTNLQRTIFQGCRFYCADLRDVDFSQAVVSGCDFSGADLTNARLVWTNLRGADLSRAILKGTRFENADMRPLTEPPTMPHGKGGTVMLNESNLHNTNLSQAKLLGASFVGAILDGAILENADLEGADFSYATLSGVQLKGAKLRDANFRLADMTQDMFKQLKGSDARVPDPVPQHILDETVRQHMRWVETEGTAGRRAVMVGWYMAGAYLAQVNLSGADLRQCNLANANLHGAKLICSDLRDANLMYANFTDADLRGSAIDGARGIPTTLKT